MLVNADFARSVVIAPHQYEWVASPQPGVERVMLDRVGAEHARATSIVRYAPGSCFPPHAHPGGEEIFVLSGTFSDENDDFPEGWYFRNPPGSSHRPSSREGALIFVKLRQMAADEDRPVRIDTREPTSWQQHGDRAICPLFSGARELVCLQRLAPNGAVFTEAVDGAELFVLAGELIVQGERYERGTWIRLPAGQYPGFTAGLPGLTFYLKTGQAVTAATEE